MRESFWGAFPAGKDVLIKKARPSLRAKREPSIFFFPFSTNLFTGVENLVENLGKKQSFMWMETRKPAWKKHFRAWKIKIPKLWKTENGKKNRDKKPKTGKFFHKRRSEQTDIFKTNGIKRLKAGKNKKFPEKLFHRYPQVFRYFSIGFSKIKNRKHCFGSGRERFSTVSRIPTVNDYENNQIFFSLLRVREKRFSRYEQEKIIKER